MSARGVSFDLKAAAPRWMLRVAYRLLQAWWTVARPETRGVKIAVIEDRRVLLVRHAYGRRWEWELPGGGVRRHESSIDAARREAAEELGCGLDNLKLIGVLRAEHRALARLWCFSAHRTGSITASSHELLEARWFALDALPHELGSHAESILRRLVSGDGLLEASPTSQASGAVREDLSWLDREGRPALRITLHDFAGHPFQAQLSRALATRGHEVTHVTCGNYASGKGSLDLTEADGGRLSFMELTVPGKVFRKHNLACRVFQELVYGLRFVRRLRNERPEIVIMCNVPLLAHYLVMLLDRRPTIFWHQDVYSEAWAHELRSRVGVAGRLVGKVLDGMERRIAAHAAHTVVISDSFRQVHDRWQTPASRLTTISNWAPIEDLPVRPKHNSWRHEHGLSDKKVLLYSGTLGLKHRPEILVDLYDHLAARIPNLELVVVSSGSGADYVRQQSSGRAISVYGFQPFEALPDVLGSADALVVILEPHASAYSVPSKTLSYLCAARPIVGMLPESNPAACLIAESGGIVIDGAHLADAADEVAALMNDDARSEEVGVRARALAEQLFDIDVVATRFEHIATDAALQDADGSEPG